MSTNGRGAEAGTNPPLCNI